MRIKDINIKTRLFSVSTLLFLISLVTIVLLYIRITATISLGDETINVAVAYKMTQGFRPFVDMWELYQIGDLIWLPFLMLFVKISGGTTGIILFSRLLYLAMNIGLLICCAVVLKKKLGKIKAVFVGLILMCYAPFCLYYNWYDTEMIFFGFLGTVLLLGGLDYRGRKQKILMVASGVAYGCMVVSYPSIAITIPFIGVGLIITNILRKKKQSGCMHSIPIGYIILG